MKLDGPRRTPAEELSRVPSVVSLISTFWGLAAVLALGAYTTVHSFNYEPPAPKTPQTARMRPLPPRAPVVPYTGALVTSGGLEPMIVHLACNQEDARWARVYDPPSSGRGMILRIDQSADLMRALYAGEKTQFPVDTRVVTTPCTQTMIENGEFP